MSSLFNVSKAASLGLHAAALLAHSDRPLQAGLIAGMLDVSQAHLSKILPRLAKAGLIAARPGPGGGFTLARPAGEITLKEVYEAIEGPVDTAACPFALSVCDGGACPLDDEFREAGDRLVAFMARATLSDVRMDYISVAIEGRRNDDKETSGR